MTQVTVDPNPMVGLDGEPPRKRRRSHCSRARSPSAGAGIWA